MGALLIAIYIEIIAPRFPFKMNLTKMSFEGLIGTFNLAIALGMKGRSETRFDVEFGTKCLPKIRRSFGLVVRMNATGETVILDDVMKE